jgi:hypothetical protein
MVSNVDDAPAAEWHIAEPAMAITPQRGRIARYTSGTPMTRTSAYCVVVAIGHGDKGSYRSALQLAAREAKHRGLAVKLVHGSVASTGPAADAHDLGERSRRGRRILNAAARELREMVDDDVRVYTNNSPLTAVDALLGESLTAPLIVLQRNESPGRKRDAPGVTMSAVAAQASCPVALAPSGNAGRVATGVVMRLEEQDRSALARSAAWDEAALRRVPLTVEHAWDGPFSRTLTSAHLPPSRKDVQRDRDDDLRRLAEMVTAMEEAELERKLVAAHP